jgi:hypothetical protein
VEIAERRRRQVDASGCDEPAIRSVEHEECGRLRERRDRLARRLDELGVVRSATALVSFR